MDKTQQKQQKIGRLLQEKVGKATDFISRLAQNLIRQNPLAVRVLAIPHSLQSLNCTTREVLKALFVPSSLTLSSFLQQMFVKIPSH